MSGFLFPPSSFGGDLEASNPRYGGGSSSDDQVLRDDEGRDGEIEIDSGYGEEDLTATPAHVTSTLEVELEPVPDLHPLGRVHIGITSPNEVRGPLSMNTPSWDEAMVEMSHSIKDFLTPV